MQLEHVNCAYAACQRVRAYELAIELLNKWHERVTAMQQPQAHNATNQPAAAAASNAAAVTISSVLSPSVRARALMYTTSTGASGQPSQQQMTIAIAQLKRKAVSAGAVAAKDDYVRLKRAGGGGGVANARECMQRYVAQMGDEAQQRHWLER